MSVSASTSATPFRVPSIIKRNMALFALSQSFTGAGMQFTYGFGPLMVLALTGSPDFAGVSVGLVGLSRFFISYPIGKITDAYGRKPGILMGLTLALAGTIVIGLAMAERSFALFVAGVFVFGMGMNASQQLRVAATDMFPPQRRAQALGYLALGSLSGLIVSPGVVSIAQTVAARTGQNALGLAWYLLPALILPGMVVISFVRPDPKEIGQNLHRYYPGHVAEPRRERGVAARFSALAMLRRPAVRLAVISNCAAQGNMSIVMVLTSLVLSECGTSLTGIAISHMFHSMGMFAFTIPLGRLTDRYGRDAVMFPGVGVALAGAALVAYGGSYLPVTLGTFLVGLGWAAANVSATALIADHYPTAERGRALGVSDTCAAGVSVAIALCTGPIIAWAGLAPTGLVAAIVATPPLLMLMVTGGTRRLAAVPVEDR
ncbi:MAG TPA: MFS transporter [Stellaceae bacterium]|nr:MFS transporter [Stellaceae bacterium]